MGRVRRPKAEVRRSENPELRTQNNRSSRKSRFFRMSRESRANHEIRFTGNAALHAFATNLHDLSALRRRVGWSVFSVRLQERRTIRKLLDVGIYGGANLYACLT